jgi:hypothetical protein
MSDTREVLGVWTYEGLYKPRNRRHSKAREDFIYRHFGGQASTPPFIWRIEFHKVKSGDPWNGGYSEHYEMTLHRFASKNGGRYPVWVKGYDERGEAVNVKLAATCAPETYKLPYRTDNVLPPEWLLLGNPEPDSD